MTIRAVKLIIVSRMFLNFVSAFQVTSLDMRPRTWKEVVGRAGSSSSHLPDWAPVRVESSNHRFSSMEESGAEIWRLFSFSVVEAMRSMMQVGILNCF